MLTLLHRQERSPIALDIGAESIRMLQMQRIGNAANVSACASWKFPASSANDPSQRNGMAVAAVREMLRNGSFRGRWVISALSCEQLSIKNIRLPQMPEYELRTAVMQEARERFGWEMDHDQLSYLKAGRVRQGTETRDEIIMMAVRKEAIEEHISLVNDMGLKPTRIEAKPISVFRSFERFLRRQADDLAVSVVVDIGFMATRIVVAMGRQIIFIKRINIGGRKFTEAVASQFNLGNEEASDLRRRIVQARPPGGDGQVAPGGGDSVDWTIHDAVRGEVEALAREIGLCLRYCSVTFRGFRPKTVTLTGGEANDPIFVELLKENLGIDCVVGQPLRGIDVSAMGHGSNRRGMLSEWAACAGMAMGGIDIERTLLEADNGHGKLSA